MSSPKVQVPFALQFEETLFDENENITWGDPKYSAEVDGIVFEALGPTGKKTGKISKPTPWKDGGGDVDF